MKRTFSLIGIGSLGCIGFLAMLFLSIFLQSAHAEGRLPNEWKQPIEQIAEFQEPVGGETSTEMINNLVLKNIIPIGRFVFIAVALLFLGLYAYLLALGSGSEEQLSTQRSNLLFAALGFSILGIAPEVIKIFDPNREGDTSQLLDQQQANDVVLQVINFLEIGLGAVAIVVLFYGGVRLITANGDEEAVSSGKNIFLYGFMGFMAVMLADPLITEVFYPQMGEANIGQNSAESFVEQGLGVIMFLLQFVGAIIFLAFLYAGFLFLFSGIDEEQRERGKRILIWTVIGFIIVILAYSIVMFFLPGKGE